MFIKIGKVCLPLLLLCLLAGCGSTRLTEYNDQLECRIYGVNLGVDANEEIEEVLSRYAVCLLDVNQKDLVDRTAELEEIAPDESAALWSSTYEKNATNSKLERFQLLDLLGNSQDSANALVLCEAQYQDQSIAEDHYLFIIRVVLETREDRWIVKESQVLGTARAEDVTVVRDDITKQIKFRKESEQNET